MSAGRRKVGVDEHDRWVFNRMADAYAHRPAYPEALVEAIAELGARVLDVGAGVGHLALPLAARGLEVMAVEPASMMLEQLRSEASRRGLRVEAEHAAAEALPVESASADVVVIADAVHFVDAELAGLEIARVLAPGGALAIVTSELGETPFMRGLDRVMAESAPRRPRSTDAAIAQIVSLARLTPLPPRRFTDATPVDAARLEQILRSISFIGPAMSAARFAAFREEIRALPGPLVWARAFTLHAARSRRGPYPT